MDPFSIAFQKLVQIVGTKALCRTRRDFDMRHGPFINSRVSFLADDIFCLTKNLEKIKRKEIRKPLDSIEIVNLTYYKYPWLPISIWDKFAIFPDSNINYKVYTPLCQNKYIFNRGSNLYVLAWRG